MENLVKQMRERFSGFGQDNQEGLNNTRQRRLPPQKTQSFKGERKNWFQRQLSGQMNPDKETSESMEFAATVAAAAFAVNSLEEAAMQEQKKIGLEKALTNKKRKEENRIVLADPGRHSRRFTGKEIINVEKAAAGKGSTEILEIEDTDQQMPKEAALPLPPPILKKTPTFANQKESAGRSPTIRKTPTFADEKGSTGKKTTIRKTPTFSDAYLNDTTNKRIGITEEKRPSGDLALSTAGDGHQNTKTMAVGGPDTIARAWEEAQMARIKKRYDKMKSTIDSWENEKKTKERRRADRVESQLDKRRASALQHYRVEISKIDQVAGGARALADERKKNEETRTKEKAKKIRSTGKLPATCFCF
ncbi:hypothetical protein MKW94_023172 [Papaver nudicaule]|uniref:Remorin C-terminal domain-containing protein n=1 Tax=Papaver nudicaule TaxID=74823 RepID=A0AA41VSK9_PAPNU|nr:hypothetical protein [Papaver nudicaule]